MPGHIRRKELAAGRLVKPIAPARGHSPICAEMARSYRLNERERDDGLVPTPMLNYGRSRDRSEGGAMLIGRNPWLPVRLLRQVPPRQLSAPSRPLSASLSAPASSPLPWRL